MQASRQEDDTTRLHIGTHMVGTMGRLMAESRDAECFRVGPDGFVAINVRRLMGDECARDFSYQLPLMPTGDAILRAVRQLAEKPWMTAQRIATFIDAAEAGQRLLSRR